MAMMVEMNRKQSHSVRYSIYVGPDFRLVRRKRIL